MEEMQVGAKSVPVITEWEKAYAAQLHDATVGRLFRGIVHNLNGVVQAFSMQSELFDLMFRQADCFFAQIFNGSESEKTEALEGLYSLLNKRAVLAEQMNEKVRICQQIVQRTLLLSSGPSPPDAGPHRLGDLIKDEMDFLCADSFFKHKVDRDVVLAVDLEVPSDALFALRLALQAVLHNALESLKQGQAEPRIRVASKKNGRGIALEVADNGPGFSEGIQEQMFLPFFSTKEGHAGLGLYMARKSIEQLGGSIAASSSREGTVFVLQFCPSAVNVQNDAEGCIFSKKGVSSKNDGS